MLNFFLFGLFCQDLTILFGSRLATLKVTSLHRGKGERLVSLWPYLVSHFPLILGVVASVVRAAVLEIAEAFGTAATKQCGLLAFPLEGGKWLSLSLFFFLLV